MLAYTPNFPLSIIATIACTGVSAAYGWLLVRYRAWLLWSVLAGSLLETTGFIARTIAARSSNDGGAVHRVQFILLLIAPTLLSTTFLSMYARIVLCVSPEPQRTFRSRALWLPPKYTESFLVAFNILSLAVQTIGAVVFAGAGPTEKQRNENGRGIIQGGLVIQILCFALFAVFWVRFMVVAKRWKGDVGSRAEGRWRQLCAVVFGGLVIVQIRTIFRLFEFDDSRNYVSSHEWVFWVFDALPVLVACVGLFVFHPARYLPIEFLKIWVRSNSLSDAEREASGIIL
ncbi:unnamed protein product [Periconia digitata]|uniref:Uncharacterized protein n=1 Tax=Periconia digitata TaxID=1303443 RepID=A0A9W4UIT6_9PLEO|nr:unnamed protein product [Periconia digitata]